MAAAGAGSYRYSPPALQLAHAIRGGGRNFVEKSNLREYPIPLPLWLCIDFLGVFAFIIYLLSTVNGRWDEHYCRDLRRTLQRRL